MPVNHKLCLPFVRQLEPNFLPKENFQFEIPNDYLETRFQSIGVDLEGRFNDDTKEKVPIKEIKLPDLTEIKQLPKEKSFSVFNEYHKKLAQKLIAIFLDAKDVDELMALAVYIRDQVNPYLFTYGYSVALSHRSDTQEIELPALVEIFPLKFVGNKSMQRARKESTVVPVGLRRPIEIERDYTASDLDPEHRMAYFREDVGINAHHWHWHLVYPTGGPERSLYAKDRRGELFYYMHEQVMARYNVDRLCNGLFLVEPFHDFKQQIKVGYFPKMNSIVSSRSQPSRQDNAKWNDIRRDQDNFSIRVDDMIRWRDRIIDGIHKGFVFDRSNKQIPLNNDKGIDILGDLIEASQLSANPIYFGNLHNLGHGFFSLIHDPDNRYREEPGVMGDTTTAMRDPVFYMWHAFINSLFEEHKMQLPSYTADMLAFSGVKVEKVDVIKGDEYVTELETFWQKTDVNIENGLDFSGSGPLFARFTHLNHDEFSYRITINNTGAARKGTVRIFLCPNQNEASAPYNLEGMRKMAIEMDKFVVNLRVGQNKVVRMSSESSVIIPFSSTFPDIVVDTSGAIVKKRPASEEIYCRCGWPEHMLLPKGNEQGYPFLLYVLVTDHKMDDVGAEVSGTCSQSFSFCGLRNKKYPDKRPMGFPFDRPADWWLETLQDFKTDNASITPLTIRHVNEVTKYRLFDNVKYEHPEKPKAE